MTNILNKKNTEKHKKELNKKELNKVENNKKINNEEYKYVFSPFVLTHSDIPYNPYDYEKRCTVS